MKISIENEEDKELIKNWKQDIYNDIWNIMIKYDIDIRKMKINKKKEFIDEIYNKIKIYKDMEAALPPSNTITIVNNGFKPYSKIGDMDINYGVDAIVYDDMYKKNGLEIAYGPDGRDNIYSK